MSAADTLAALRAHLDSGDVSAARRLLQGWDLSAEEDPALHLAVARAAERAGALDRAVSEYNLALRAAPQDTDTLRRLARLRADRGDWAHAERAYRRCLALAPDDPVLAAELAEVQSLLGPPEPAALSAPGGGGPLDSEVPKPSQEPRAVEPADLLAPSDADLVAFVDRFAGREGVYARQWCSPTGKHGYTPVREPLTPTVVRAHLLGAHTVGVYPVRQDGTARFVAFDLDVARYALGQAARQPAGVERLLQRALGVARTLLDAAASLGLPAYLERSGWKGYHVWLFFEAPVPAAGLRRLAAALLRRIPAPPPDVTVEVFPKQSRVRSGGLGNLIKLPLGVHRVTGALGLFVDPSGRPLADQLELVRAALHIGRGTLAGLLRQLGPEEQVPDLDRPAMPGAAGRLPGGHGEPFARAAPTGAVLAFPGSASEDAPHMPDWPDEDGSLSPAPPMGTPREHPPQPGAHEATGPGYSLDDDIELLWLLQRCPVLAALVGRVRRDGVVANRERLVLTYTLGHLSQGAQAVNAVLSEALTVDPSAFLTSRLRGNPMSCPKIRSRVPDATAAVACDCSFESAAGLYPTPLLHLRSLRATHAPAAPLALHGLRAERMVAELYRLRAQIERAERLASDLESRLRSLMEDQGVAELSTTLGTLRLSAEPDGPLSLVLPGRPNHSWRTESADDGAVRDGARSQGDPGACPAAHPQGA